MAKTLEQLTESVEIPKAFLETGETTEFIREALAATLFYTKKITGKKACDILGITRRKWEEEILPRFGYTAMRDVDDAEVELKAATW